MAKVKAVEQSTLTVPAGGSAAVPEGWVIIGGARLWNGDLHLLIRKAHEDAGETVKELRAKVALERSARKAAERVNADEVLRKRIGLNMQIESLEEEVAYLRTQVRRGERCQHCNNLADERSFMCVDCASEADAEVDDLRMQNERVRKALADHERDRATAERIESKVDKLIRLSTMGIWCDDCQRRSLDCVCP